MNRRPVAEGVVVELLLSVADPWRVFSSLPLLLPENLVYLEKQRREKRRGESVLECSFKKVYMIVLVNASHWMDMMQFSYVRVGPNT